MEEHKEIEITTLELPAHDVTINDTAIIETDTIFVETAALPEQVNVGPGFALSVSAKQEAVIDRSGALAINAGRNAEIRYGGTMAINAGGHADIHFGGAMVINAGGAVDIESGGALVINSAKGAKLTNSTVGVLLSPKAELGEGTRVILNTKQAVAFGAAFGVLFALLRWLLKR